MLLKYISTEYQRWFTAVKYLQPERSLTPSTENVILFLKQLCI